MNVLVKSHSILRTRYKNTDSGPVQIITQNSQYVFQHEDVFNIDEKELEKQIISASKIPFDLYNGPVLRVHIFSNSPKNHTFLMVVHHIVSDGLSLKLLFEELWEIYQQLITGEEIVFRKNEKDYFNFVEYQNELIKTDTEKLHSYWERKMQPKITPLQLPVDYTLQKDIYLDGDTVYGQIDSALKLKLQEISKNYQIPISTTLLAALQVLLNRYSDQTDIITDMAVTIGREQKQFKDCIGYLVNSLPIRQDLSENIEFKDFLKQTRRTVFEALQHRNYPYSLIAKTIETNDYDYTSLADVLFNFLDIQSTTYKKKNELSFHPYEVPNQEGQFKLLCECIEQEKTILVKFKYRTSVFKKETITQLVEHYLNILKAIAEDPEQKIFDIDFLSKKDKKELLEDFNKTQVAFPKNKTILDLFKEKAQKSSNSLAVVFDNTKLTYKEIDEQTNRLAHLLIDQLNIQSDDIIALTLDRSERMIIAILAILKAGAAYLPIDPTYPEKRLAFILDDAKPKAIISDKKYADLLYNTRCDMLILQNDLDEVEITSKGKKLIKKLSQFSYKPLTLNYSSQQLAYIIYTSGSTGQPKGVMIEHKALMNRLLWMQKKYPISSKDIILQKTNYSFDVSVWELLWWAISGAKLAFLNPGDEKSPDHIINAIEKYKVSIMHFVPSMFSEFLHEIENKKNLNKLSSLRQIFTSGEALLPNQVNLFNKLFKDKKVNLTNLYGPTEACIDVSYFDCPKNENITIVPIGKPIDNTTFYILDKRKNILPKNAIGELYIGGINLARGYLNRTELTEKSFIYHSQLKQRLYKTGDLVRWLSDGNVEYKGRIDHQVKIRGFRIELGEISQALLKHEAITEAAVLDITKEDHSKYLNAFIIPKVEIKADELRRYLKKVLPAYMVPSNFTFLEKFPVTSNGKLDRKKMVTLAQADFAGQEAFEMPENEVEQKLLNVWEKIFNRKRISISDSFFSLGGDSILAIQIVRELKKNNIDIKINDLLELGSIRALSSFIIDNKLFTEKDGDLNFKDNINSINTNFLSSNYEATYPASRMQELMIHQYQNDKQLEGFYHLGFSWYMAELSFIPEIFQQALDIVTYKYPILRTVFHKEKGQEKIFQSVKNKSKLIFNSEDISHLPKDKQDQYIDKELKDDKTNRFDPFTSNEELIRFRIFVRSTNSFQLFYAAHHAIIDGWSNIELLKNLLQSYVELKEGKSYEMLKQKVNPLNGYQEFIKLEEEILQSNEAYEFWQNQLKNVKYSPIREKYVVKSKYKFATCIESLDAKLTDSIIQLSKKTNVNPKIPFLIAYMKLVAKVKETNNAQIGIVSNGRSAKMKDPLETVGMFWNIVPFYYEFNKQNRKDLLYKFQKRINQITSYSHYPLPQILHNANEKELFFACFNFIHFHNANTLMKNKKFQIKRLKLSDRFHYPLTLAVELMTGKESNSNIRFEYNKAFFSDQDIDEFVHSYKILLKELVEN